MSKLLIIALSVLFLTSCGFYNPTEFSERRDLRKGSQINNNQQRPDVGSADVQTASSNKETSSKKTTEQNNNEEDSTNNNDDDSSDDDNNSNDDLDPAAGGDPNIVVFRIQPGTNNGAWNNAANPIRAFVGQTIRFVNDDTDSHYLHSNNSSGPCPHGTRAFQPGESYDCVVGRVYDSAAGMRTWDHVDGRNTAPIHMNLTNNSLALTYASYDADADKDLPPPEDCGVDH